MSRYSVYVLPDEFKRIKRLPGNVRQRVTNAIDELADDPRPTQSKKLDVTDAADSAREVRRLRLDNWRRLGRRLSRDSAADFLKQPDAVRRSFRRQEQCQIHIDRASGDTPVSQGDRPARRVFLAPRVKHACQ